MMHYYQFKAPDISLSHSLDQQPIPRNFHLHTHAHAELYCFLAGNVTYHVEGTAYPLQPGDILLMRPGEAHYAQVDPAAPYERICVNFDTGIVSYLDPEGQLLRPFFDRKAGKGNLYRSEDGAYLRYMKKMCSPAPFERVSILANLMLLLQELGATERNEQPAADQDTMEYQMIRYINKNLGKELTLEALCERFFVSRTELCRRFKGATGVSVGSYIRVKRLLLAQQLLQQGQKPTEVFSACGYRDYSTFFRAYSKYFGHGPGSEQQFAQCLSADTRIVIG